MVVVYLASLAALLLASAAPGEPPRWDELVQRVNSNPSSWLAARNPAAESRAASLLHASSTDPRAATLEALKTLDIRVVEHDEAFIRSLPDSFHPREKWPNCTSFDEVRDQGSCHSSWAVGVASTITDRYCTFGVPKPIHISAEDINACCFRCSKFDCRGGSALLAWSHWQREGFVTGGNFGTDDGCMPYSIANCSHVTTKSLPHCAAMPVTPRWCQMKCREGYNRTYQNDKRYGRNVYIVQDEQNIMAEIYKNGPVQAEIDVYNDFVLYQSGVFRTSNDSFMMGTQVVKILGWGVEKKDKYWLAANSWNSDWGENGFFRIARGENQCNVETLLFAGDPKL